MKLFMSLCRKEIKNIYRGLLIILAIIVVYTCYFSFFFELSDVVSPSQIELLFLNLGNRLLYLFPILFVYSLYKGGKNKITSMEYSLRVKKHLLLLIRFLILVSAMILMTLMMTAFVFIMNHYQPRADNRVIIGGLLQYFCFPFISLSLVCAAWGSMQVIKRYRPVLGLAVMVTGFGLSQWLMSNTYHWSRVSEFSGQVFFQLCFTFCMSAIFCGIGIYFYRKYGSNFSLETY